MHPHQRERSFGYTVGAAFVALAAVLWWRGRPAVAGALGIMGVILAVGGLAAPSALRVPRAVWMRLAGGLGWINSRVLLTIFFALVLTPTGWVMRLGGWDPFGLRRAGSQWLPSPPGRRHSKHYEHLF